MPVLTARKNEKRRYFLFDSSNKRSYFFHAMKNQAIHSTLIEFGNIEDLDLKVGDKLWIGTLGHLGEAEVLEAEYEPSLDATIVVRYAEAPEETSELSYRELCDGDCYLRTYSE